MNSPTIELIFIFYKSLGNYLITNVQGANEPKGYISYISYYFTSMV